MVNILAVIEDGACRHNIKYQLCNGGYTVTALEYLDAVEEHENQYDLILLENTYDYNQSDITYLKNYYNCAVIIMLKAFHANEIVECMKLGADDYVIKPIREIELLAKVKFQVELSKNDNGEILGLVFDDSENSVLLKQTKIYLTKNEYRLCKLLAKNHLITMTKERIYESIYEWDTDTQMRTITEYIYSVRRKFKKFNIDPIKTIWGTGYRWIYTNLLETV